MNIETLKLALIVKQHGSLAAAARVLEVDASSVSRDIASLEKKLGIRLFQRTTRRLSLTEAGQIYLDRIVSLISELEAAQEEALGLQQKPSGILRLTASVAFTHEQIVPLLPEFQQAYPDIEIDLQGTDNNLDLIEYNIDLAIRLAPSPKGDLISTRLMTNHYHAVASPVFLKNVTMPQTPDDLKGMNCLRFSLPGISDVWHFQNHEGEIQSIAVSGTLKMSNALALRQAARNGMGVTLLADWMLEQDLNEGRLVNLFPNCQASTTTFDTAAWVLYPSRTYLPRKVRVMIDFLKLKLGKN